MFSVGLFVPPLRCAKRWVAPAKDYWDYGCTIAVIRRWLKFLLLNSSDLEWFAKFYIKSWNVMHGASQRSWLDMWQSSVHDVAASACWIVIEPNIGGLVTLINLCVFGDKSSHQVLLKIGYKFCSANQFTYFSYIIKPTKGFDERFTAQSPL